MSLVATESQYKILERINPLQTTLIEQSIVSSRVALLLRSAEIKLLFFDLSFLFCHEGNCHLIDLDMVISPIHKSDST